jgi:hypothetical protein
MGERGEAQGAYLVEIGTWGQGKGLRGYCRQDRYHQVRQPADHIPGFMISPCELGRRYICRDERGKGGGSLGQAVVSMVPAATSRDWALPSCGTTILSVSAADFAASVQGTAGALRRRGLLPCLPMQRTSHGCLEHRCSLHLPETAPHAAYDILHAPADQPWGFPTL